MFNFGTRVLKQIAKKWNASHEAFKRLSLKVSVVQFFTILFIGTNPQNTLGSGRGFHNAFE